MALHTTLSLNTSRWVFGPDKMVIKGCILQYQMFRKATLEHYLPKAVHLFMPCYDCSHNLVCVLQFDMSVLIVQASFHVDLLDSRPGCSGLVPERMLFHLTPLLLNICVLSSADFASTHPNQPHICCSALYLSCSTVEFVRVNYHLLYLFSPVFNYIREAGLCLSFVLFS